MKMTLDQDELALVEARCRLLGWEETADGKLVNYGHGDVEDQFADNWLEVILDALTEAYEF